MTIIEHPSPNHSARKKGVRIDTVVIHHTATHDYLPAASWLCDPRSGVSAHYLVDREGHVTSLVPEDRKAWHAGKGRLSWETCEPYDFNHRSIGIELVNPGDGVTPFTEAQYEALAWLVPDVVQRLGWTDTYVRSIGPACDTERLCGIVLGHRDIAPGRKTDPADNFDWGRVRESLAGGVT